MVSSEACGASPRFRIWNRSASSARSIARSRSGRSGWPGGVRWSRQAGWVMRSVVIQHTYPFDWPGESPVISTRSFLPALAGHADAGRWRRLAGHEERGRERLLRVDAILLEVGDAFAGEEAVVDQEIAGKAPRWLLEDEIGGIGHD